MRKGKIESRVLWVGMHRYAENLVDFVHCPNAVLLLRTIGTTCNDAYNKAGEMIMNVFNSFTTS